MPISTDPFELRRTHSWLLVYRKSLGMLLNVTPPHGLFGINAFPCRTNGGLTTLAACNLPRISTCTLGAAVFGTRASAMDRFKVGEKVPLVTSPAGMIF